MLGVLDVLVVVQVDTNQRLGSKREGNRYDGSRQVRAHPWFHENEFDFKMIESKDFDPPIVPAAAISASKHNLHSPVGLPLGMRLVQGDDEQRKRYPDESAALSEGLADFGPAV